MSTNCGCGISDHSRRTAHREGGRAATRDHLGPTGEGGSVALDADRLDEPAEVARPAGLNRAAAGAALDNRLEHPPGPGRDHG
jgi:hypothetical protein